MSPGRRQLMIVGLGVDFQYEYQLHEEVTMERLNNLALLNLRKSSERITKARIVFGFTLKRTRTIRSGCRIQRSAE